MLRMRLRRRVLLFAFPAVLLLGLVIAATIRAEGSTYRDPGGAYSFTVPSGWQGPLQRNGSVAFLDASSGTVLVITARLTKNALLADGGQALRDMFPREVGGRMAAVGTQDLSVGGRPAKRLVLRGDNGINQLSTVAVLVENKGTTYLLRFQSTPEQEQAMNAVATTLLTSWQFH